MDEFDSSKFDIIINATTVGLGTQKSIISKKQILKHQVIFDMVYNPLDTKLLKNALLQEARIIYGIDMLIYQAIKQHEIYTGHVVERKQIFQLKNEVLVKNHNICLVVIGNSLKELIGDAIDVAVSIIHMPLPDGRKTRKVNDIIVVKGYDARTDKYELIHIDGND